MRSAGEAFPRGFGMPFDYDFRMRIGAPRPTVFERLLRIEHLSRWFCGWSRIEPKVGGSFKFGGETCIILPDGRGWETKIDEGEVLRRFAFTWPIQGSDTRVAYELEDAPGDTTILRASHSRVPVRTTTCGDLQDAWRVCLGNLESVAEGRGDSIRPDHAPVMSGELRLSVLIEAPPVNAFAAFANPADVGHWSSGGVPEAPARVEPRAGGAFSLGDTQEPNQILEWSDGTRIVLRAKGRPEEGLAFDFEEKASGTAIYLTATGFDGRPEDILRQRGRWSDRLVCLKNFVESGSSGFLNAYRDQIKER
jgi:uncharacterized protein YndB with AHSA1/START domain